MVNDTNDQNITEEQVTTLLKDNTNSIQKEIADN